MKMTSLLLCSSMLLLLGSLSVRGLVFSGEAGGGKEISPHRLSGDQYWLYEKLGRLRNMTETETEIRGEYFQHHGWSEFKSDIKDVRDPQSRNKGYKYFLQHYIAALEIGGSAESLEFTKRQLRSVVDAEFETAAQWKSWFNENSPYLVWSAEHAQFIVDELAKQKHLKDQRGDAIDH